MADPRTRATAVVAGLALDAVAGEPAARYHPVARFGDAMTALERHTYRDSVGAGAVHALAGVGGAVATGWLLERLVGRRAALIASVAIASAGRMLTDEVAGVARALEAGELVEARTRVGRLVGRDTSGLDEAGVARAAIETLAENGVDAVIATLWWGLVGGAPAVLGHRAANTLDAMIGHRSPRYARFGRVAAQLDDVANWVPARVGVLAVALAVPARARTIGRTVRRDAGRHPSPNGGVIEAATAAALGVRLGGTNRYGDRVEDRGTLGDGPPPTAADVGRAIDVARRATAILAVLVLVAGRTRSGPGRGG